MSDKSEVVATATAYANDSDPDLMVAFIRPECSLKEAFRITWPDGTAVEFPAYAFQAMQQVCRQSFTLPVEVHGDTGELVQSIDRLVSYLDCLLRREAA